MERIVWRVVRREEEVGGGEEESEGEEGEGRIPKRVARAWTRSWKSAGRLSSSAGEEASAAAVAVAAAWLYVSAPSKYSQARPLANSQRKACTRACSEAALHSPSTR